MLDVVTALTYGSDRRLRTDLAAMALDRRVRRGERYELTPTDTFWTVLLHCLLDKGRFSEHRIGDLTTALPDLVPGSPAEAVVTAQCPEGWSAERLVECVGRADWESLNGLAASLSPGDDHGHARTGHRAGRRRAGPVRAVRRRLPRRNSLAGNAVKAMYGAVWAPARPARTPGSARRAQTRISLSGLDGSGKSSQAAALADALGAERETALVWIPFDIWPGSMLRMLPTRVRVHLGPRGRMDADADLTRARAAESPDGAEPVVAAQPHGPAGLVPRTFWWTVATLAAVSAGTSLGRRVNRTTSEVVVIDRYRLDTIVKLQTWYPSVSRTWLARIVLRLAPAPDVECLLRVEGAEAFARKPEQYSALQLARQARMYDEMVAQVPGALVVDGQMTPAEVTEILARLARSALHGG
jgi:thymidylate kinase